MAQFDNMTSAMPPPVLPGFSLRVQLFSSSAYSTSDRPIRCFRVVTDRSATIREFCQEASRIHEINYGQPLAIKKCQDDQEFDVTQTEIVGNLFASMSTIRVIQASSHPSIRDSVPPTSALRFDPTSLLGKRRGREASPRANGTTPAKPFGPNKRRRVSQLDPDDPIPSREESFEEEHMNGQVPDNIPNSQESVILGASNGHLSNLRNVRPDLPCIAETPSPPASELKRHPQTKADQIRPKHGSARPNSKTEFRESSTAKEFPECHPSQQRAKSASYHIPRPTERGTSVSTAATSPLSIDQQSFSNGIAEDKRKSDSKAKRSEGLKPRSLNEDSLYETIVSDDERPAAVLKANKAALKIRNSPKSGLLGMERANNTFNTPPNGRRRFQDQPNTPGELPLTPNSKKRENRQKQTEEAESSRKARVAAAEAAEQRKREATEARRMEEARRAEEEREAREEQERNDVEDFQRGEAERQAILKEQQEKKRMGFEKKKIAQEKEEADRLIRTKAVEKGEHAKTVAESSTKITSPVLPTSSPFVRAQSTTGFFPNGRKSALKSSSAARSSSPAGPRAGASGVGIETQMPLPKSANRRVSFGTSEMAQGTPSDKPATSNSISQKDATPVVITSTTLKAASMAPILPPQPSYKRIVPPPSTIKRSSSERSITTPLPEASSYIRKEPSPSVAKKFSPVPIPSRANVTPVPPPVVRGQSKTVSVESLTQMPEAVIKSSDDDELEDDDEGTGSEDEGFEGDVPIAVSSKRSTKEAYRHTPIEAVNDETPAGADSNVEIENAPKRSNPVRPTHRTQSRSPAEAGGETDEDEDVEAPSDSSSRGESRSPVVYSQHEHAQQGKVSVPMRSPSRESEEASEIAEADHPASKAGSLEGKAKDSDSESDSESAETNSDAEDTVIQAPGSSMQSRKTSSPVLPKNTSVSEARAPQNTTTRGNTNKKSSKAQSPLGSDQSTQDALDQQLTSSVYEARTSIPPTSSQILPPTQSKPRPSVVTLTGLAQKRQTFSGSAPNITPNTKNRTLKLLEQEEETSDEESEEEEDDESDDDSTSQPVAKATSHQAHRPSQPKSHGSDSSSDESEGEISKIRNELMAQVAGMHSQSQINIPSPKPYKSTPDSTKSKKSKDRYLSGYSFSQPV